MTTNGKRLISLQKASDEQILSLYNDLGSVWRVAEGLGMCGQSVHERLVKMGAVDSNAWTSDEVSYLVGRYTEHPGRSPIDLVDITNSLNMIFGTKRCKTNVCRKARSLGLGTRVGRRMSTENKVKASIRASSTTRRNIHSGAAKSGFREDIGLFVRSRWEANYARYLNMLIASGDIRGFEYEPKTFFFRDVKRGPFSYRPDFLVELADGSEVWHEVKGWMDSKSRSKLKRMARFYPDEKIEVIGKDEYFVIEAKYSKTIEGWEHA